MNLNSVHLIGRLTRDPEAKALPSGSTVVSFSIATSRTWKDKESGEKKEESEFHNCVAFGRTAETIAQYVKKGQLLFVDGRLQTRSWDDKDSGKKMYRTEIVVENFQFGPKAANTPRDTAEESFDAIGKEPAPQDDGIDGINPEDIPF